MKTNLFILLILLLSASACDKETPEMKCREIQESPQEFLDYWYFPTGSWWVYELKERPGVYDTVRVIQQQQKNSGKCYGDDCYYYDRIPDCTSIFYSTLRHSNRDFFDPFHHNIESKEELNGFTTSQNGNELSKLQVNSNNKNKMFNYSYMEFYPVRIRGNTLDQFIIADTNQVTTPIKTFSNSVHIENTFSNWSDSIRLNSVKDLYFSKNVGIIKRVYTGNQTWELVNYFINK